jgi:hypothetical protein
VTNFEVPVKCFISKSVKYFYNLCLKFKYIMEDLLKKIEAIAKVNESIIARVIVNLRIVRFAHHFFQEIGEESSKAKIQKKLEESCKH